MAYLIGSTDGSHLTKGEKMKVFSILKGLIDPRVAIEVAGTVYFMNNPHSKYYSINKATIESGRLCVYYDAVDLPEHLEAESHYVKVKPLPGTVELVIKEYDPSAEELSFVSFYTVCSMYDPDRGCYFRYRKYIAGIEHPRCDNLTCTATDEHLIEEGFCCVEEVDDDGKGSFTVYEKRG